jgi:hypothetical protein
MSPDPRARVSCDEEQPFIPVEARPAVAEDLARTAWRVGEALRFLEVPRGFVEVPRQ